MARTKQTLAEWIKEAMNDADKLSLETEEVKKCTGFSLVHLASGVHEKEIHSVRLGSKAHSAEELGRLFMHKAESYCQELPGVQLFTLLAFYNNETTPAARHPFRIQGEIAYEGTGTEAPTAMGLTQQQMRHTEGLVSGSFRQNAMTFEVLLELTREQAMEARTTRKENTELVNMMKELMMQNLQLQYSNSMQLATRNDISKLIGMAPALVNSIAGKEVFPTSSADTAIMEALAQSMTPDQVRQFAAALPPQVMPHVMNRITEILKSKMESQKAQAALIPNREGKTEVETDAEEVEQREVLLKEHSNGQA